VRRKLPGGRLRLRTYLGGLILVFAVAALAGALYAGKHSDQNARGQALQEAAFAAKSGAKVIDEGVMILQGAIGGLAGSPAIPTVLAHPSQCTLSFAQLGPFPTGHIDLVRSDGAVVCSSGPPGASHASYAGQSWLTAARVRPVAIAPIRDPLTGQPVALFTALSRGAFVAGFVNLRPVGPNLNMQLAGPPSLRYIVTTADRRSVLARSSNPAPFVGRSIATTAFYRQAGSFERPDLGGTTRLFAEADVPGLGWRVYAGLDRAVALSGASRLYQNQLLIILAALLVVLAATAVVGHRIARPIAQLSAAVRRAAGGGGWAGTDIRAPVAVSHAPAEVADLAEDFEALVAAVQSQLAERERAEEVARAAETEANATAEAYRNLFENHPQPMWIYDETTLEIFEVNESAVEHYGYSREEFLAMTIKDLRPEEDVPALLESIAAARHRDRSGPWRHVKHDGTLIEVEISSHTVEFRDRPGRLIVATDVTDRERLQRQLDQGQRLESLGQLAGGVAHDFNNLLGVILNYAGFVGEELESASDGETRWAQARADVEQIEQAARRASDLTHQLLAFARREVIHAEVMNLNDTVRETHQLLGRTLGEHVELSLVMEDDLWPVLADPGQVEQILVNLAVNARDAMPRGGTLLIETANIHVDDTYATARPGLTPGRYARLRVSDTGVGMDARTVEHAFEPFFTTKPKGEGTGLGLATIYGIVTQAGGYARLYSEPGIGTTCTVMLPATEQQPSTPGVSDIGDVRGRGEVVLVVEDEDGIREVARRILDRNGYEVLTAAGGPEAIELARTYAGSIDLLLSDLIMPRMMGVEVADKITETRPGTLVMFMSGYAHPILDGSQGVPEGTILIEKPFTETALLVRVREALGASAKPGAV
jgi:PAS domain S-box-containing protein